MPGKTNIFHFVLCLFLVAFSSCSSGNPQSIFSPDLPDSIGIQSNNERSIIGIWRAEINQKAQSFTIEPVERSSAYHYSLTSMYPDALSIMDYGWSPNFWADIRISHPLPFSGIDVFDPRVIAVLPANPGVSMEYPAMNVQANYSVILKPDGYTKLFDNPTVAGNANPFIAYFKDQPNRIWSSSGLSEETIRWQMDISGFGGPSTFNLIVDISTNYPAPSAPITDNTPEPFEILDVTISDGLTSSGGSATINVSLFDWQGFGGIGDVLIEAPDLFVGTISLDYVGIGTEPFEHIYMGTISNDLAYSNGRFKLLVSAWDETSGIHMYQEFLDVIHDLTLVSSIPLSGYLTDMYYMDGYVYVAHWREGLSIIDVRDINYPQVINRIENDRYVAWKVVVSGEHAYVLLKVNSMDKGSLSIFNVNPPQSAYHVKTIDLLWPAVDFAIENGYAYIAATLSGMVIIDIDPPESASIVHTVETPTSPMPMTIAVDVEGDYAYIGDLTQMEDGFSIVDISVPESAYILNSVDVPSDLQYGIFIQFEDGYVHCATGEIGFQIVDVDPPESASVVKTIEVFPKLGGIDIVDGYGFARSEFGSTLIVDISRPETAAIKKGIGVFGWFDIKDGYVFALNSSHEFEIWELW